MAIDILTGPQEGWPEKTVAVIGNGFFFEETRYGVYGYILFSVLLMRNPFEKVLFSGRLIDYMIPKMEKNSPAAIIWSRLSIEYLGILGIPYTFGNRLSIYLSTVHTQKAGQR